MENRSKTKRELLYKVVENIIDPYLNRGNIKCRYVEDVNGGRSLRFSLKDAPDTYRHNNSLGVLDHYDNTFYAAGYLIDMFDDNLKWCFKKQYGLEPIIFSVNDVQKILKKYMEKEWGVTINNLDHPAFRISTTWV